MTHQNHQTNGASLEDCHTNFYALTDLCGIKWRKFVNSERPNASSDPLADPILRSYSRCMQADILCVWRRVQSTKPDNSDPNSLAFDITTSKVHPPLSLAAAKELWIFWYGEEPDLSELVDAELLRIAASTLFTQMHKHTHIRRHTAAAAATTSSPTVAVAATATAE